MAQKPRAAKKPGPIRKKQPPAAPRPNPPETGASKAGGAFTLRGTREIYSPAPALPTRGAVRLVPKAHFTPGSTRAVQRSEPVEVQPDDLVEVEFSGGGILWMRGEDYRSRLGGGAGRSTAEEDIVDVTPDLRLLPEGLQARGPIGWAVKSLKVFGVDLEAAAAQGIAKLIDERTLVAEHDRRRRPKPGLYRCPLATDRFWLEPTDLESASARPLYLLFIHGVASSTWGSFGDLWSADRRAELDALQRAYGDHALAYEYATLTRSPIESALLLAADLEALPEGTRLHLVTHSSGGLIGELICRAGAVQPVTAGNAGPRPPLAAAPFSPEEHRLFERGGPALAAQAELLKRLDERLSALARKAIRVERLVRVACPALGTTLASGRLDRWLAVFGNLAGTALPDSPLADMSKDIGDFMAAVVKQRTDPAALPGLAALMPDSTLIQLINWPTARVDGDLAVIAGDIDPDAWWTRLLVWVTDRFYDGDHDLVVNTPSMYGGAKRSGRSVASFHKGPAVNHFRYFQNPESARRLAQALTAPAADEPEGFEPLRKPTVDIARAVVPRSAEPRPVVFVLPGIMGSELAVDGDRVWLDVPDLVFGGFEQLRIEAANVRALRPFARYYGEIIEYLAQTHKVVPFAFDWRIALEKEADRLAADVRRELDAVRGHRQPVRFLAHSLGGLVARAMIARHEALWREVCATPGARLVMLGTPTGGSHAITELLVAQSAILRKLARCDITHSPRDLLEVIARFPGVLSILPRDPREDYFSARTWRAYHARAGHGWVLPHEKDLERAREFRRLIDGAPVDPAHMLYVAGCADVTAAGMHLDPHENRIRFEATTRGDGRVTWESGIPPGVPTWYMEEVEHGDLTAYPDAFEAVEELLSQGTTHRLPQSPPVARAVEVRFPMPEPTEELFPDEDGLAGDAIGAGPRKHRRAAARERPVQVCVAHGNLAYARYPVAVGHYAGDTIISAERHLDLALASALTRRHQIGLYPAEIGTNAVFINPKLSANPAASPRGAVVVGLGTVGSLNAASLTRSIRRALLEYAVQWKDFGPREADGDAGQDLGVSALLIGTGAGGIPVDDSVFAMLQAVGAANRALAFAKNTQRIRFVEFIELFEDRAIQAVEALRQLGSQAPLRDSFRFEDRLEARRGGLSRVTYEEPGGWWHRLQVLGGSRPGAAADGSLRFSASTRRARGELRLLATQRALIDQFIQQSILTTRDNRGAARTLFELLLPNEIKDQAPDQDDTVLILDEEAARYPWELLDDRFSRGERDQPLFVAHGLLRQLESFEFRENVRGAVDDTALVIGDPLSRFPELKGAQAEAKAVHRAFQSDGRFRCELRERPSSQQVINALYAADYKVLHLAGHGVYRMAPEAAGQCTACRQPLPREAAERLQESMPLLTGMIIGDGVVLSPQEVHQMRSVPELVFINCCHLGAVEPGDRRPAAERNERNDYNRIAANVATEFIRMGVRAVVAAGWAVDDSAALTFAGAFYDRMLKGRPFGEAVQAARRETFERHSGTNTWGAYQCYGDPDYRLARAEGSEADEREFRWVSPSQAIAELNNLTARLATRAGRGASLEKRQLKAIAAWLAKQPWQNDGRVWAALGRAFGEAGLFERAITYYRRAVQAENSQATLKDIEQLANFESRHAVRLAVRGESQEALAAIDRAIARLDAVADPRLVDDPAKARTVERLSLLGSAWKRRALVSKAERLASLQRMLASYRQAGDLAFEKNKRVDPYPLLNRLTAELALAWQEGRPGIAPEALAAFRKGLSDGRLELESVRSHAPEIWGRIGLCDIALLAALAEASFDDRTAATIAEAYREASRLASPREFESVFDQFDFLGVMAGGNNAVLQFLRSIRTRIQGADGESFRDGGAPTAAPAPHAAAPLPRMGAPEAGGAEPHAELLAPPVWLGASAPAATRPGAEFTARFAAYLKEEEAAVEAILKKLSPGSQAHLGLKACRWKPGTPVRVTLAGRGLTIANPSQEFVWEGTRVLLDFDVRTDPDAAEGVTVLKFDVLIDGIVVATLRMDLEVADAPRPEQIRTQAAESARTAFASYSSQDRSRVLDRVAAVRISAGLDVFLDCLSLHPGEEWKPRLAQEIRGRDLFLLFWSESAAQSRWVAWEWQTALAAKGKTAMQVHPLEAGAKPPEQLKDLHFGDVFMLIRTGIESTAKEH